ncbi:protein RIC-3 isoform X3 [Rhineura floridana]|nr:protein RIC-3 isoform X3 [Rhineura floridana]
MSPEIRPPVTHFPRSHLAEAVAKAKGAVGGGGSGGGGNNGRGLVGQVIPIYGFGILLYILYILFKLSSKGKSSTVAGKCPSSSGNTNRKISYPEETYPVYDHSDCFQRRQDTILVDYPDPSQPSAEEIAERMELVDDECLCSETLLSALAIVNDDLAAGCEKDRHARFSDQSGTSQNFEKCSCCHYEEDNPAVIAENEGFYYDSCSETEEAAKEERLVDSDHEKAVPKEQNGGNMDEISILRKRNPKGVELLGH